MHDILSRAKTVYQNKGAIKLSQKAVSLVYSRSMRPAYNRYWNLRYGTGTSILEKDWDNLLLLDACRYDEFCHVAPFGRDNINQRITLGSKTPEFLQRTFKGRRLHDLVYVTANPQVLKFQSEENSDTPVFHDTISLLDRWDTETQTIRPETVRDGALEAARNHPNKRLIIHFLQPHAPFLGPKAEEIQRRTGRTIGGLNPGREYTGIEPKKVETASYQEMIDKGITREEILASYRETLWLVIAECQPLINTLPGKTVITSDHGELLGDRIYPFGGQRWEHPADIRSTELCVVPWVEFDTNDRKLVTSEPPKERESVDQSTVDDRLRSLGYL